jgi:hypothetical protein
MSVGDTGETRRFTVLFVEDDFELRDSVAAILRKHGFEVLVASDGYVALSLLLNYSVDLVFADVRLPGFSGFEFAEKAKLLRPGVRVLYTTGWRSGRRIGLGSVLAKCCRSRFVRRNSLARFAKPWQIDRTRRRWALGAGKRSMAHLASRRAV